MESSSNMTQANIMNIGGVDCYEKDGVAYLRLETVARGLGFTQEKNGIEYIRWDRVEQYMEEINFPQKWGRDGFIPENIFYRLAMKAKSESAEAFQAKVADEIIPSIRKHGVYATEDFLSRSIADPAWAIGVLQQLQQSIEEKKQLEQENIQLAERVEALAPIKQYYDTILQSNEAMSTTQIAMDYGLSAYRLNKILEEHGYQRHVNGSWVLTAKYVGYGYATQKSFPITYKDGTQSSKTHMYWTQKGRIEIHYLLESMGIKALMDRKNPSVPKNKRKSKKRR